MAGTTGEEMEKEGGGIDVGERLPNRFNVEGVRANSYLNL